MRVSHAQFIFVENGSVFVDDITHTKLHTCILSYLGLSITVLTVLC